MPLYTYIASYKGATHVSQKQSSNFQGFGHWAIELPKDVLPPDVRRQVMGKMYGGFEPIPNRIHAWQKTFEIDGSAFTVVAVQTEG